MGAMRKGIAGILLGAVLFCWAGVSEAQNWTLYYRDGVEIHYYDKASVTQPRPGIVQVSIKITNLGFPEGKVKTLEMACKNHNYRELSDKIDPITGARLPEDPREGYRWTWFPMQAQIEALWENLCE